MIQRKSGEVKRAEVKLSIREVERLSYIEKAQKGEVLIAKQAARKD